MSGRWWRLRNKRGWALLTAPQVQTPMSASAEQLPGVQSGIRSRRDVSLTLHSYQSTFRSNPQEHTRMTSPVSTLTLTLTLAGSLALSLLITVPCSGALVRLRANYNPRGLQLDDEGNVEPHTGPVVTTFFGMLKRVKRIEVRIYYSPDLVLLMTIPQRDGLAYIKG